MKVICVKVYLSATPLYVVPINTLKDLYYSQNYWKQCQLTLKSMEWKLVTMQVKVDVRMIIELHSSCIWYE